jgi:hypothetical protein
MYIDDFKNCQTPGELYDTIESYLNWGSGLGGGSWTEFFEAKKCAVRLRKLNPALSPVPQTGDLTDILQWCIENQQKDELSTAEPKPTEGSGGENGGQTKEQQLAAQIIKDVKKRLRVGESSAPTAKECSAFMSTIPELVEQVELIIHKLKLECKDAAARELEEKLKQVGVEAFIYPKTSSCLPNLLNISPEKNLQSNAGAFTRFLERALPYLGAQPAEQKPPGASGEEKDGQGTWYWKLYEKTKAVFSRIPHWIYILTLFLAALLTCLYYLGGLQPIKLFIYRLFTHK